MIVKAKDTYYVLDDCYRGGVEQEYASRLFQIKFWDKKADMGIWIGSFREKEDAEQVLHRIMTAWSQDAKMIDVSDEPGWN